MDGRHGTVNEAGEPAPHPTIRPTHDTVSLASCMGRPIGATAHEVFAVAAMDLAKPTPSTAIPTSVFKVKGRLSIAAPWVLARCSQALM